MIVSFRHKGLERFFRTGSKAGIQAAHETRLRLLLGILDQATGEDDVKALPGLRAHRLSGREKDFISVWVNGNWRVTFRFVGADIELVDYRDYH